MQPDTATFGFSRRQRGLLWLCLCLSPCLFWGGILPARGETSEIIRQQDEEEARKKVLRASDTLDQIEGTVEGHTHELQQLQQELSQMREEVRHLRERLARASVSPPEAEKAKDKGKATADSSPPKQTPATGEPHTKVVTGYYYKVQAGDTLSAIAEAYRQSGVSVTAEQIRAANGLSRKESLRPGRKLFIPKEASRKRGVSGKPAAPPS